MILVNEYPREVYTLGIICISMTKNLRVHSSYKSVTKASN